MPLPASPPYKVAVIGYGFSAKVFQIPLIQANPRFILHAIVQRSPKHKDDAESDFPSVKIYRSTNEVMEDKSVDVVVISTIPTSHYQIATQALMSGKHVVIEKPVCPTVKEVDELISLAKEKSLLLTVYQNRRWDTDFLTLKSIIEQKKLGNIAEFESHFDRYSPDPPLSKAWKVTSAPGSGVVYDLGTHLIDQIVVLFGMPKRITGFVSRLTQDSVDDAFTIMMHYDGMLATVKATVISPEQKQLRYWVRGSKGSFKKYFMDVQEEQIMSGKSVIDKDFGVEPKEHSGIFTTSSAGLFKEEIIENVTPKTYRAFYDEFAMALAGESDVPVDVAQTRDVVRLMELAKQSSDEGRTITI